MVKIIHLDVKQWRSQIQQLIKIFCQRFNGTLNQSQERGSVVVLVALALTALLGFCAIVTDVGLLYAKKAQLQNTVDAAAMAGVQELPNNLSEAEQKARDYASRNGVPAVTVTFNASNVKIIVQATQQVPTYFARIWGITQEQISVSARAILTPPTELFGAVPLSIQNQAFDYTKEYVLKSGGGSGTSDWYLDDSNNNAVEKSGEASGTPGWYGALELSGTGADTYETDLATGYEGALRVGQILDVKHGNMSGPTARGVNTRLNQIVHIPIIEIISESGNSIQQVQIVGFAAFFIEGVAGNGNNSIVTGRFIQTLPSNGQSNDFGLCTPKLVVN